MNKKINNYIDRILQSLFFIILITDFISRFSYRLAMYRNYIISFLGILIFCILLLNNYLSKNYLYFLGLLSIFFIISFKITKNASIYEILWIYSYFSLAVIISNNIINFKYLKLYTYIVLLTFTFLYIFQYNPNILFYKTSRNNVSTITLFAITLYYFEAYTNEIKTSKLPIILFAISCYWAIGRTGLVISFLTLLIFSFINTKEYKFKFDYKFFLFSILIVFFLFYHSQIISKINFNNNINIEQTEIQDSTVEKSNEQNNKTIHNDALTNITQRGFNTPRILIWTNYIDEMISKPVYFIFGVNKENNSHVYIYGENLHNSFFMLHSKTGILGLLIILILLFESLFTLLKSKNYFPIILLLLICLRSFFDWISFFGIYDILFYLYILCYSRIKNT